MKLHASLSYDEYYSREVNPDDEWDIGERGLTDISVSLTHTTKDFGYELPDAKTACVLVEHYSDGCTFGSAEYVEVKGIFPDQAAAEAHAKTLNIDHGYFGSHIQFLYFTEKV